MNCVRRFTALPFFILLAIPLAFKSVTTLQVLTTVMWYACLVLSWNLVGGYAGVLPLGHAAYVGIGAYISSLLFIHHNVSPWFGMLIGGATASLFAFVIGYPSLRLRGPYYALASIATLEALRMVTENVDQIGPWSIRGARGLLLPLGNKWWLMQSQDKAFFYYFILAFLILLILGEYRFRYSRWGYQLVAAGQNEDAARALGVSVTNLKVRALLVSAFLSAMLGTFYAQFVLYIFPQGILSLTLSFEIAYIAIVGGKGTMLGPVLGAFLLVPASEITRFYLGGRLLGLNLVVYGLMIVVFMRYLPGGLMELGSKLVRRFKNGG